MVFADSVAHRENSLRNSILQRQAGIDDATGKGSGVERLIDEELLRPHLPIRFRCAKGAVVSSSDPTEQSKAIDRVVYDDSASALLFDEAHSIFPIETVAGLVEITVKLDADKLRQDIVRMAPIKAMRKRRYLVPLANTRTKVGSLEVDAEDPRSFIVGLPADPGWRPETIAKALRTIQLDLGPPTHVHGLYVIGVGFFETIPIESSLERPFRIRACTDSTRLFRFTTTFRLAFDRWSPPLANAVTVDLNRYLPGSLQVLAE
jgi:hypothetical protein